jgi:3-hydroxybutyryl-CoA dehydrogenase
MEKLVGVIGAGVIGRGVAQALAQTGHRVVLVDHSQAQLESAESEIVRNVRFHAMFGGAAADSTTPEEVIERIAFRREYDGLTKASFVIENVSESWSAKNEVYQHLEATCPKECVYAANTSAISITRIAAATGRREQVLGMHFMNPVPLKPVVEVIRGYHTSEATLAIAKALLAGMGKEAVVVNDSPGFVSNRVLMLTVNEAIFLVQEQVAQPEDVDRIFKDCFGHKMGPLETADLIGLDTILLSLEVLYESFSDSKYRPCTLLRKMVDAGLRGRKSGQGFYHYGTG